MLDSARRALAVTVLLAALFAGTVVATGGFARPGEFGRGWDVALLALNTLPLLLLHRQPLAVVLVFCVAYPLWLTAGHEAHMLQSLPALVALYAVGAWPRPLWLRAVGLVLPVWMMSAVIFGLWVDAGMQQVGYIAVMYGLAWVTGVVVAARRSYITQLEEKTTALEQARQQLAARAVADERARIARELHDVVAHAMSVITVRAGVGAHLIESRPAAAAEALRVIERTGREALSELRRMLAVLREPDSRPGSPPDPQPGLADLPRLADQVGEAGVPVTVTTEGRSESLPAGLDLAAYRVAQEALTNVVKHAPRARAAVTVRYRPRSLEVEVRDRGSAGGREGAGTAPAVPGQGLRGMAERVALYEGRLDAGPDPDGPGFRVVARFPRDPAAGEP